MAATHVQTSTGIDFGATTVQITVPSVAAGNALVGAVGWLSATATLTSIVDDRNGAWTTGTTTTASSARSNAGYKLNCAAGTTVVTATISATASIEMFVSESTGAATSGTADASTPIGNSSTTGTSRSPTSINTTIAGCFNFAACFDMTDTTAPTASGGGYTTPTNGTGTFGRVAYEQQASAGATQATFTETTGVGSHQWVVAIPPPAAGASAALTGTAVGGITEGDVVAGGKTIIITLTSDTFISN